MLEVLYGNMIVNSAVFTIIIICFLHVLTNIDYHMTTGYKKKKSCKLLLSNNTCKNVRSLLIKLAKFVKEAQTVSEIEKVTATVYFVLTQNAFKRNNKIYDQNEDILIIGDETPLSVKNTIIASASTDEIDNSEATFDTESNTS